MILISRTQTNFGNSWTTSLELSADQTTRLSFRWSLWRFVFGHWDQPQCESPLTSL